MLLGVPRPCRQRGAGAASEVAGAASEDAGLVVEDQRYAPPCVVPEVQPTKDVFSRIRRVSVCSALR